MKRLHIWTSLAAISVIGGCQSKNPDETGVAQTSSAPSKNTTTPPAPTTPELAQIPAELKNDAYEYYGLGYSKPMNMEIRVSDQKEVRKGAQTITLKEIKDGVPTFTIDRTGDISELGVQEVRLEKDGIYNSASTIAKVGPHDLEMPANLAPGSKWTSKTEVDQPGRSMVNQSTFKVVGTETVKTKAGEHQALLITSTGTGTIGGKTATTTSKSWYVKGLGGVKTILVTKMPGLTRTITIEETK